MREGIGVDEADKERLLDQFRDYLDAMEELPETPSDPGSAEADLFSVFVELAAVRNEVRTESRLVKEALDQFRGVFDTLRSSQVTLEQALQRAQAEARERGQALLRPLLLDLLELRDRLEAALQQPAAPPQRRWFGHWRQPQRVAAEPWREGVGITARRLDRHPVRAARIAFGPGRPALRSARRKRHRHEAGRAFRSRHRGGRGTRRIPVGRRTAAHRRGDRQQDRRRRQRRMTEDIVGIDLGTTNSEIALYRDGRPEVLADEQGRKILPSVVGLTETGEVLVGEEARNQWLLYPERTVRSIKRRMGRAETVRMGERDYTPQEISAIILRRLKEIAEVRLGRPVRKAVITVPAYFSDTQRQATREAGEIAGLEVVRIINEPTAAALVYEAGQHEGKRILVYDLGGGTFDVSVVRIEEGVVEVISSHGNNHLGGDDFDQKIVAHILEHLKINQAVEVSDQPRAMARILRAAEAAKKHLSDHPFARIEEEYLADAEERSPVHLSMELTRDEYRGDDRTVCRGDPAGDPYGAAFGRPHRVTGGGNPAGRRRYAHAGDPAPAGGSVRPRTARRSGRRSVRGHGRGHPGRGDLRTGGVGGAGGCHPVYLRHQCAGRTRRRVLPVLLHPDHRAQYADPGAQERNVLHRGRQPDRGRCAHLPGRESLTRSKTSRSAGSVWRG